MIPMASERFGSHPLVPAKAGTQGPQVRSFWLWVPAQSASKTRVNALTAGTSGGKRLGQIARADCFS
jgi:hypothetical protein